LKEFEAKTTVTKYCSLRCAQVAYKQRDKATRIDASNISTQEIRQKPFQALKAKEFLSVSESCYLIGISRFTFYRLIKRKQIRIQKVGRRTIIKRSAIDAFFKVKP
jgi:excisionase family DNA binding protein